MDENGSSSREEGMVVAVEEFCKEEMPEEVVSDLKMVNIFRPAGQGGLEKQEHMVRIFFRYARKLRQEVTLSNYIPD